MAQRYSLIHPRCGTSFLFWVIVLSVFVYAPFGRLAGHWIIVSRIVCSCRSSPASPTS